MTVNESTQTSNVLTKNESSQTNNVPAKKDPNAGKLNGSGAQEQWSVESVLQTITPRYEESTSPLSFFHLLERLKTTKRAGWQRFGIGAGESISDHMYRMSILTMTAPASITSKLDIPRCTRMALVHDMAEALVGDITPVDNVAKDEKSRRESDTMDYICNTLLGNFNGGLNGQDIQKLWQEYEDSETAESLFVHDIDKIELLLQMNEYERSHPPPTDLGEFTWVATKIQSPEVKLWAEHVLWERVELWNRRKITPQWQVQPPSSKPAPL